MSAAYSTPVKQEMTDNKTTHLHKEQLSDNKCINSPIVWHNAGWPVLRKDVPKVDITQRNASLTVKQALNFMKSDDEVTLLPLLVNGKMFIGSRVEILNKQFEYDLLPGKWNIYSQWRCGAKFGLHQDTTSSATYHDSKFTFERAPLSDIACGIINNKGIDDLKASIDTSSSDEDFDFHVCNKNGFISEAPGDVDDWHLYLIRDVNNKVIAWLLSNECFIIYLNEAGINRHNNMPPEIPIDGGNTPPEIPIVSSNTPPEIPIVSGNTLLEIQIDSGNTPPEIPTSSTK